ncbi:MAG: SusC/RagA family TonB-linked outer membrane protein [Flexibacteraceae bacterium]
MNRTITRAVLLCLIFCFSVTALIAQTIKVSGEVVSGDDRQPIPGVAVRIKGGQTGTITDGNGRFTVSVEPGATLEFISLGYTPEEKLVEGTSFLKITLKVEAKQLKEVVIGYGKQERRKMVGSVATVNAKALENVPTASFEQNLQGRVAGVQLSTQGGVVGSASRIRIRGGGQIGGTGEPLFVIDGIILDQGANGTSDYSSRNGPGQATNYSALSYIDQSDIETMSILKDASATAIYGARGANGVVIITTKSGKVGKPRYNFNVSTGVNSATRKLDFLNGEEWFSLYQEARQNDGLPLLGPNDNMVINAGNNDAQITLPVSQFANTNWVDQTLRNGIIRDANFNVSGGTEAQTYSINASAYQNEGILKGNSFDRYAVRANVLNKGKYVDISYNNSLTYVKNKIVPVSFNPGGFGSAQSNSLPIFPIYNPDGSFFGTQAAQSYNTGINPVAYADNDFRQDVTRSLNMVRATVNFLPYLKTSHSLQTDLTFLKERFYYSGTNRYSSSIGNNNAPAAEREKVTSLPGLDERTVYAQNILTTHQIDFNKTFKEKHTITATAGFEYNYVRQRDNGFFSQGNNFGGTRGQSGVLDPRQ